MGLPEIAGAINKILPPTKGWQILLMQSRCTKDDDVEDMARDVTK